MIHYREQTPINKRSEYRWWEGVKTGRYNSTSVKQFRWFMLNSRDRHNALKRFRGGCWDNVDGTACPVCNTGAKKEVTGFSLSVPRLSKQEKKRKNRLKESNYKNAWMVQNDES